MKISIESTTRIVEVNGLPARVWEGQTDSGIPVAVMVTRIGVPPGRETDQFERELEECRPPTALGVQAWPARMVL